MHLNAPENKFCSSHRDGMLRCLPFNSHHDPSALLLFFFYFVHIIYSHFCPAHSLLMEKFQLTSQVHLWKAQYNLQYVSDWHKCAKWFPYLNCFASFQTFHLWQEAAGAACSYFSSIESQIHEYECVLLKSWPLIPVTKIKDSCLVLAQGCIKNARTHLTLTKSLFLHLQSAGRSSSRRFFVSLSPWIFARLIHTDS